MNKTNANSNAAMKVQNEIELILEKRMNLENHHLNIAKELNCLRNSIESNENFEGIKNYLMNLMVQRLEILDLDPNDDLENDEVSDEEALKFLESNSIKD